MPATDTGKVLREIQSLIGDADCDGLPDGQLLARFVDQRDESAFELLVRRYGRLVFGVCRRVLADPHAAEDAFQATFLVLVHKARSLDRRRPVADWLYTVASRLARRARANAARRREREVDAARHHPDAADPPTPDDTLRVLHEELNRLPEQHRVPLVLSYLEGRTYEQVARAIGYPVGSVGWRLARAKEALRDRLASRGVVCPATGIGVLLGAAGSGAAVPAPLVAATVRAGLWFAGEQVAEGAVSAQVIELARGALGTMTTSKWALAAGVLLAIGLGGGTVWMARSAAMADDPKPTAGKVADAAKDLKPAELPAGATARMGSTQFRHGEAVFFIAYTADGKHLVTAGRDNAVILWDRATGQEVRRYERASPKPALELKPPMDLVMPVKMMRGIGADDFPVALSPDGKTLVAGKDGVITVWDVATGKTVHELTAAATVSELVFTPDGTSLLSVDANQAIVHWDPATGKQQKTTDLKAPEGGLAGLIRTGGAISPAGTHYVRQQLDTDTANAVLRVHNLATGEVLPDIKLGAGGTQNIGFSPDGKYLVWSGFIDAVTVWDVAAHKEVGRFGGGMNGKLRFFGRSIRVSDDGKLLAVTTGNDAIEVWDIPTGNHLRTIGGFELDRNNGIAFKVVIGAGNRLTRSDLAFAPDGKTIAASLGNAAVRQFDVSTGNEVGATGGHLSGVIAVGSAGRSVVTVSKESVRVWDTAGGREIRQWPLLPPAVAAAVSPDGKRVATPSGDGTVRIWDPATGQKLRDIDTRRPTIAGLGFSPDGKTIATKTELNSAVNLWDTTTGTHLRTLGQDGEPAFSGGKVMIDVSGVQTPAVVFSPDGRFVAAAGDRKQLCVWDAASGAPVCEIPMTAQKLGVAFGFSPNGHVLAVVANGGVMTGYEVATGEKRYEMKPAATGAAALYPSEISGGMMAINTLGRGNANAGSVGFTTDGRFILVAAGGPVVRAWDTLTGQEAGQLKGHNGSVSVLRVAPDGHSLVTGSVDTTALTWNLGNLPRVEVSREVPLNADELETLWGDLAKSDAEVGFAAARKLLTDRKQAVALLKDRLRPVPAIEDARISQLVADLGGAFDARRKATAELERLGEMATPHLRKALEGNPPLELKQRVERLLEKAAVQKPHGDQLRELRSIELLELAATPEAKPVLDALANGASAARLTREAKAAAERLAAAK
jgi:RNA polymerase sigma factor (sigma-70 family)